MRRAFSTLLVGVTAAGTFLLATAAGAGATPVDHGVHHASGKTEHGSW
jgi:hypothetical protein